MSLILVGIDFSTPSRRALAWALEHGRRTGAALHTVHVVERRWRLADLRRDHEALRAELHEVHAAAMAELAPLVGEAERAQLGPLREHVTLGDPAGEIVALADELGADLVVVGNHGGDALQRLLTGSVAQKVVRDAACTVVVVKAPRGA
jgi:universal stress protein A